MSLDIGELVGYVKVDPSGVGQGLEQAQQMVRRGSRQWEQTAGDAGEKAGKEAGGRLSKAFGGSLKSLSAGIVAGLALDKVIGFTKGAIDAASDLNETVNMSSTIFGDNAAQIEKWGSTAAKNLGLSKQAAIQNAASFGDMFLQLGYAGDKATDMSKKVVQMAADLGSFKNLETDDVLERIAASFRGEYDSLQLLIPNINAARVQTEALAETGKANASELTAQEKATATLAIIQKDGARAMGDFAKTSDQAANGAKIAAAQAEDLKAKIGDQLLPAWRDLVNFGNTKALPFLSDSVDYIIALGQAVAPVAGGIADLAGGFADLPGPVKGATGALVAFLLLRPRLERMGARAVEPMRASFARFRDEMRLQQALAAGVGRTYDGLGAAAEGNARKVGTFSAAMSAAKVSMGGLKGVGSGLMSALGGPWGIAITAAAAGVAYWAQKNAEARARVEELTAAIEEDSGALGKNTDAALANQLEKSGIVDTYRELGGNVRDLTLAAKGNEPAMARVNALLDENGKVTRYANRRQMEMNEGQQVLSSGARKVKDTLTDSNSEVRKAAQNAKDHAAMLGEDAKKTKGAADANTQFGHAAKDAGDKSKDAADDVHKLASEMQAYLKQVYTTRDANRAYQASIDDAQQSLEEYRDELIKKAREEGKGKAAAEAYADAQIAAGKAIDIHTEAGRRNQENLDQVAQSALDVAESNLKEGVSYDKVAKRVMAARGEFVTMAIKMGYSRTEAQKLADKLGLTRDNVDELRLATEKLPRKKHIDIIVATQGAITGVQAIDRALAALKDRHVTVTVEQRRAYGKLADMAGSMPGSADGGTVGGDRYPYGDKVPYLLAPGEEVISNRRGQADRFRPWLKAINADRFTPAMATSLAASVGAQAAGGRSVDARTTIHHHGDVVAADPNAYLREMEAKARRQRLGDF